MEPIAIIGMGCRFPGADNPHAFWQLMCNGVDAITEVPADRYNIDEVYDPRPGTPGKVMSRKGGFLKQIDHFDAAFFGLSPREASRMDPQHRLLLEVAWEAMEDAGLVPEKLTHEIAGVFIGIITGDYWDRQFGHPADLDVYATAGSARSGAAGRISYALGLRGVSVALDAACSSSLVAVHLACQSLRTGSCTMALAGGVNIILNPDHTIGFSQGRMMAPDGHCKAFDARADGYVRSEGAGVVILKPLSRAQADGDPIYALILGGSSNNDGHCELFMAPSVEGQQAGLRMAYRAAGIDPRQVQDIEAHGTGTSVGDPVEITALGNVLCEGRSATRPLLVGSVKTNIGHTEGAAGLAGIIKAALCLKHGMIPPNLHFQTPNPAIPWQQYALTVPTHLMSWPQSDGPRLAGVSSFGIAGTNAHIVLQEPPKPGERETPSQDREIGRPQLLSLSAQTPAALKALARAYVNHLNNERPADQAFSDICYTSNLRRTHHEYRLAVVARKRQDAHNTLSAFLRGEAPPELIYGNRIARKRPKIVWIFPGQGSQWLGMGRDLLAQEPVFRRAIEECEQVMRPYVDWSLLQQLQADEGHSRLNEIAVVQPVLFAVEVALAALWQALGIKPDAVVGHSMGEVAAAYVAGALSLEDASWIICARSKLLQRASGKGAMASVELSLEQAQALVRDFQERVSVAVSNSPSSTVLSGDPQALNEILSLLADSGIFGRLVNVDIASHSPYMDPLLDDVLRQMQCVRPRQSVIPMLSTVHAAYLDGRELDAGYWVRNLREPVLFSSAIEKLLDEDLTILLEMSPHPMLVGAIKQTAVQSEKPALALPSLQRGEEGRQVLLTTLGHLYTRGCEPNWSALYPTGGQHVALPTYPWQRQRYWNPALDRQSSHAVSSFSTRRGSAEFHPILGTHIQSGLDPHTCFWTTEIGAEIFPYLSEHCVHDMPVLPCAAYIELALAAASEIFGPQRFSVEELTLKQALFLPKGCVQTLQVALTPQEGDRMALSFLSAPARQNGQGCSWELYATASVRREEEPLKSDRIIQPLCEQTCDEWRLAMEARTYYQGLRARGIQHGPLFQGITRILRRPGAVMAPLTIPQMVADDMSGYQIHPALLDAILQGMTPFLPEERKEDTYVPVAVERIRLYQRPGPDDRLWSHALVRSETHGDLSTLTGDVFLLNEQGQVLLEVQGFRLQSLDGNPQDFMRHRLNQLLYKINWEEQARSEQRVTRTERKKWLIFSERGGPGQQLAQYLRASGASCITVTPGNAYRRVGAQEIELSPLDSGSFRRLLGEWCDEASEQAIGIVYLWSMLTEPINETSLQTLHTNLDLTCIGVLHLLQAIAAVSKEIPLRLWLVTNGVHALEAGESMVALSEAPLWGLGRVIVYEHPNVHATLIDLDATPGEESLTALCKEICGDEEEDEVALRGQRRYVARLVHHTLAESQSSLPALFRPDSTYLITGGLGGVGLRTAQWMIEQEARHLVLMGRRGASDEMEAKLQAMRERGAAITVIKGDVAREDHLAAALTRIRDTLPPLRGIFHCAVVLDDSILVQLDRERILGVMPPKIDGAWNLHRMTLAEPLDYFVLFSSAASLIGSPGQGNYAAANAFMDLLAHYRRLQGYPALCVNWGRWGEVGQAIKEGRGERLDVRGFASIKPEEGLAILGSLLCQNQPQIGVMSFHLSRWSQFYPHLTRSSLFASLLEEVGALSEMEASQLHLTREVLAELDRKERQQLLGQYLNDCIARVLGYSALKLDAQQQLNRLGIDSLMAVELRNRIGADLDVVIPVAAFLQGITFEQLITQIEEQVA
jgi:acyl transferase domain-containing protein/acyl carrier protein